MTLLKRLLRGRSAAVSFGGLLFAATVSLFAASAPVATAQDAAVIDETAVERGLQVFRDGGCRSCHGWSANGVREGESPQGPSIRQTQLPQDVIRLTIQCGRPTSLMPYFDWQAYNLDERCYGISRFNVGELQLPRKGRVSLSEQQLDDIVAYLMARVVGLPNEPTLEECELFFGVDGNWCEIYK